MGCDIHIYTEIKMTLRADREGTQITQWFPADAYFPNPYVEMGIKDPYSCAFEGEETIPFLRTEIYKGRQYFLFALLADVRNYNGVTPMSEPRGIPEDACRRTRDGYEPWKKDAHSASYVTLAELIRFADYYPGSKEDAADVKEVLEESLINPLKERANCLGHIPAYLWEGSMLEALKRAEDIRIVFWFDN